MNELEKLIKSYLASGTAELHPRERRQWEAWLHRRLRHRSYTIDFINATPMEDLRFKHFRNLRSGRDAFSRMSADRLSEMVSGPALNAIYREFEHPSDRGSCLRWHLRGLNLDKAIRKVKTDAEVRANAIRGPQRWDERGRDKERPAEYDYL